MNILDKKDACPQSICKILPMPVKAEKCMKTTEMRMGRWAMGVSLLEHQRNEPISEEVLEGGTDIDGHE